VNYSSPKSSIEPSVKEPSINRKDMRSEKRSRDPLLDHPAILAYKQESRLNVQIAWREEVANTVKDIDKWRTIVHEWIGRGWNKQNVKGMLDAYRNGGIGDKRGPPSSESESVRNIKEYFKERKDEWS
jgi:hypothetical protein